MAREYIAVVLGALVASDITVNALSPCWMRKHSVAINNRLRTGTDKGNPTV